MITYSTSASAIQPEQLGGFFVGWSDIPDAETHVRALKNSDFVVLALDGDRVVGFITAVGDATLAAYIPFLEVLPEYQHRGIGTELVKNMLEQLRDFYMIDLLCDEHLQSFYERLGMERSIGMRIRNYARQGGNTKFVETIKV